MTVRRHTEEIFYASPAETAAAIRWVLSINPPYYHTHEIVKDLEFKTYIKPNWWFWRTEMIVRLQIQHEATLVSADTKSQWFILGDLPDFYNRYLRDFMRDVRLELQQKELGREGTRV